MKKLLGFLFMAMIIFSCSNEKDFSGKLDIPETIFNYSAIGKGIPCIAFTGAENLDKNLYPKEFLEHINLIHASPDYIPEDIVNNLTLDDIINDIEKARKFLGVDKIAVMGHSMFSMLPLDYAVKYPDNVLYSISTGSIPFVTDEYFKAANDYWENEASEERKNIRKNNLESLNFMDKTSMSESEKFINQYNANVPYRFYNANFDASGLWKDVEINMAFVNKFWGELLLDYDNTNNYRKIQTPALVLSGKYDFGCPYYLWKDVINEMQNGTFILFENAGHNPMLEIPDEFSQTVIKWIDSQNE